MDAYLALDPFYENDREALKVLALIVAEFETDPMSVQCFDLRVVERAKTVIKKQEAWERSGKLPPMLTEGMRRELPRVVGEK